MSNNTALIEALIFTNGEPIELVRLVELSKLTEDEVVKAIEELASTNDSESRGVELVQIGGRYQFRTKEEFAEVVRNLKEEKPKRLSVAALETLAIIAYRQPIVRSDIERIRGVDATPTIKTLLERDLVKIVGHQSSVGQPALFGTTDEFLKLFSLGSLSELPTLRDIGELEADPGETAPEEIGSEDSGPEEIATEEAAA